MGNSEDHDGRRTRDERRRIDWAMDAALASISAIDRSGTLAERMARAAKSSELLSAVWSLPPAQRLMFHPGVQLTAVDPGSTPGFDGDHADGERFIEIRRFHGVSSPVVS